MHSSPFPYKLIYDSHEYKYTQQHTKRPMKRWGHLHYTFVHFGLFSLYFIRSKFQRTNCNHYNLLCLLRSTLPSSGCWGGGRHVWTPLSGIHQPANMVLWSAAGFFYIRFVNVWQKARVWTTTPLQWYDDFHRRAPLLSPMCGQGFKVFDSLPRQMRITQISASF